MSLVMDDHGPHNHRRRSGTRVSTKSKAPSPPGLKDVDPPGFSQWCPGHFHLSMEQKENLIDKEFSLAVVLPGGVEKITTVHGSKPLMDLLVMLCAKYHLNPSSYTLEPVTANRNHIKFKPNTLIGTLEAEKIILKAKGGEDEGKKAPRMPEATVRMMINYKNTQKTILRVNPRVPLAELLPAICEKCEFDVETTVLLRDVQSLAPLDLSCSLNDYAIREVYARDTRGQPAAFVFPASPTHAGTVTPDKGEYQREQENKGRFTKFKKSKKKSEQAVTASAPASPVLVSKPRPLSMALPSTNSSPLHSPSSPFDGPKKRRAPLPPGLVSQGLGTPLDLSTRRRLHSEPDALLDGDQAPRLSRGSSTDSSLKRTKRKAPPPPSSLSLAVQDNVFLDENSQGGAATNTLEEIMEKEETAASVISATASETQGDDGKLEIPADGDVTQNAECEESNPPPAEAEMLSVQPVDESGEDQSPDLSSDGNHMQSTVNDSATHKDLKTTTDTHTPGVADTESGPCQDDNVCQQTVCEEFTAESVKDESQTECSSPPSLPQPAVQNAEAQASVQAYINTLREETGRLESSVDTSMSRPIREDAQVQTDFTAEPVPPQQHRDGLPSSANAPGFDSAEKKAMTTSMEEMNPPDLKPALALTSETSDPTPSPAVATKAAIDSMPPPKPSNELTRDYIPKVGMTTYTIVPQKYTEKLRYYEVELTLESPSVASEKGNNAGSGSVQPEECTAQRGQTEGAVERQEMLSTLPREDFQTSKQTTTTQTTVNGTLPEPIQSPSIPTTSPGAENHFSSFANRASQDDLPAEVKEMKIPPATKPKPGSFRLAQHKRTSGYYVTSAAGKSPPPVTPGSGQREAHLSLERENLPPPPPPPTEQCEEDSTGATKVELSSKEDDDKNTPILRLTRQCSLPTKERSAGLSLEKLRSFAAPRPYSPFTPSRFAQAVSSAVKRSHSLSHGPKSPQSPQSPVSPVLSPVRGHSSIPHLKELSKSEESDTTKLDGGGGSAPQGAAGEPSFIDIAPKEASSP
ncbi:cordon-bleu protein-like 1b isoform X2 [Genypterus blacodes]